MLTLCGDCYIHFQRLICQIHIWCGDPSPAECTDMIAGTTSRESVSAVIIWLWESIRGGWVLIFYHSLNNMFAWKNILSHKSKMTCFWSIISPQCGCYLLYVSFEKKKTYYCVSCSLSVLSFLTYCNYAVSFVYMFVLLHAVKSNYNRIQSLDSFMYHLYHGSSNTAWPSPTNDIWTSLDVSSYERGGVSMTWGHLFPYNIPWQY